MSQGISIRKSKQNSHKKIENLLPDESCDQACATNAPKQHSISILME